MPRRPASSLGSTRRKSYSEGAQIRGDRSRRVAVPMPSRVQDLEGQATRHFQMDRPTLSLHHRGASKLKEDRHLGAVQAGDVVVAKGLKPRGPDLTTTFRSDYKGHAFEPPPRAPQRKRPDPVPFKGRSEYQNNYPGHATEPPPPPPPRAAKPHVPFNSSTEYQMNYPGHAVEPPPAQPRRDPKPNVPFEGDSTYRRAYRGHEIEPPPPAPARRQAPKVPFNANSTYLVDYPGHRPEAAPPAPPRDRPPAVPFLGNTEYQRNYIEQPVDVPKYIFLEPAVGD